MRVWKTPLYNEKIYDHVKSFIVFIHSIKLINKMHKGHSRLETWEKILRYNEAIKIESYQEKPFIKVIREQIGKNQEITRFTKELKRKYEKLNGVADRKLPRFR